MDTRTSSSFPRDLGVATTDKYVLLFSNLVGKFDNNFHVGASSDGLSFKKGSKLPSLTNAQGTKVDTTTIDTFRIAQIPSRYILFFKNRLDGKVTSQIAESKDAYVWKTKEINLPFAETAMLAPNYTFNKQYVALFGDTEIRVATTKDFKTWEVVDGAVIRPRHTHFDKNPIEIGSVITTTKGIVVIYYVKNQARDGLNYAVGAALLDINNPTKVLWRASETLWEQGEQWLGKTVYPMGAAEINKKFILYFGIENEGVQAVAFSSLADLLEKRGYDPKPILDKSPNNPIIKPVLKHMWEASAVFNSAAVYEDNKVHFVYRAMGPGNTSVLGYATSSDGETIDERLDEPIYSPTEWFEVPGRDAKAHFMSGGGYGGCEDPRITKVDDTFYMTYVAYNGEDPPRVALTSIKVDDFLNRNWDKWEKPKLISKPGQVNKNCVIFPEKIDGKFVVIHRVFPDVLIDFLDDLTFDNTFLKGHFRIPPRMNAWDSRKLGAGAPPIKTKDGWLMIYQAVDDRDPGKYKIGAMLLDLKDPSKVLARSNNPILEPTEWYENEGFKAGVAYPCGAVIMNNKLMVYYGGADTVICAASAPIDKFLEELKKSSTVKKDLGPIAKPIKHAYHFAFAKN